MIVDVRFHEMQQEAWDALRDFQEKVNCCSTSLRAYQLGQKLARVVDDYLHEESKTRGVVNEWKQRRLLGLNEKVEEAWKAYIREVGSGVRLEDLACQGSVKKLIAITEKHRRILEKFKNGWPGCFVSFNTLVKQYEMSLSGPSSFAQATVPKDDRCMYRALNFSDNTNTNSKTTNSVPIFNGPPSCKRTVATGMLTGGVHVPRIAPNTAQTMIHSDQSEKDETLRDWAELSRGISAYISSSGGGIGHCVDNGDEPDNGLNRSSGGTGINLEGIDWTFRKLDVNAAPYVPRGKMDKTQPFKSNHK